MPLFKYDWKMVCIVFPSIMEQSQFDSDEKVAKGPTAILKPRKKKMKIKHGSNEMGRVQLVLLNDVSTLDCVQNAKEFRQSRQSHGMEILNKLSGYCIVCVPARVGMKLSV
eukprot:Gb_20900 [translate_table: standard]